MIKKANFDLKSAEFIARETQRTNELVFGDVRRRRSRGGVGDDFDYDGMFKVVKKDDTTIQIFDSFEADNYDDATNAGLCQINGTPFTIPKTEITVSSDESHIYLFAELDGNGDVVQPAIEIDTNITYESAKFKGLISRQHFSSGKITSKTQEQYGFMFGWIYGDNIT